LKPDEIENNSPKSPVNNKGDEDGFNKFEDTPQVNIEGI
jgi:hypothetical protein